MTEFPGLSRRLTFISLDNLTKTNRHFEQEQGSERMGFALHNEVKIYVWLHPQTHQLGGIHGWVRKSLRGSRGTVIKQ